MTDVTIEKVWDNENIKCVVVYFRGHRCGYVGLPSTHPFVIKNADYDAINLLVHGGLTYFGDLQGEFPGYLFYGWDYAHAGDAIRGEYPSNSAGDKWWELEEVEAHVNDAAEQLKKLI